MCWFLLDEHHHFCMEEKIEYLRMLKGLDGILVLVASNHTQAVATKPLLELDFPVLRRSDRRNQTVWTYIH
jgi:hypothetical protein